MVDVQKHIDHWIEGAAEDLTVAQQLIEGGRHRHGLFFVHLALEKGLKARVCRNTQDMAPWIHNLVRLADLGGLSPTPEQLDLLAEVNAFNIEGRYPDLLGPSPSAAEARRYLTLVKEFLEWLARLS